MALASSTSLGDLVTQRGPFLDDFIHQVEVWINIFIDVKKGISIELRALMRSLNQKALFCYQQFVTLETIRVTPCCTRIGVPIFMQLYFGQNYCLYLTLFNRHTERRKCSFNPTHLGIERAGIWASYVIRPSVFTMGDLW